MRVADLLNTPTDLPHEEADGSVTTYKLRAPTIEEIALFTRWLEGRARASAGRATELPDEMQVKLLKGVNEDIAAGVYEWGGECSMKALNSRDGQAKILSLIFGVSEERGAEIVDQKERQTAAQVGGALKGSPKEKAQLCQKLGLRPDYLAGSSPASRAKDRSRKSKRSRSRKR